MSVIILKTLVNAPIEQCFDLARSIDLHVQFMKNEKEEAIAGCTSGLIGINETVTWKAKHLGFYFTMTSRISAMKIPVCFIDEMVKGPFKRLHHQHIFAPKGQKTEMTDIFEFSAPLGWLGLIVEKIFLKGYMKRLLLNRNKTIQEEANKYLSK